LIALILVLFFPFLLTYGRNARYYAASAAASLLVALAMHKDLITKCWTYLLLCWDRFGDPLVEKRLGRVGRLQVSPCCIAFF
jgi:hypothetical protein